MPDHPAHRLAEMAANAAQELRGYVNPSDPFPWELSAADRLELLPHLHGAVSQLAACIAALSQAGSNGTAKHWLAEGAQRMLSGCDAAAVAYNLLADNPDKVISARISSLDFPNGPVSAEPGSGPAREPRQPVRQARRSGRQALPRERRR